MNQDPESTAGRDPDARSGEELARLLRVEEQLKKARPRAPSLDAAALERAALSSAADPRIERDAKAATLRARPRRGRRRDRRLAAIAASWVCGAVAGGLVVFFMMGRGGPVGEPAGKTAQGELRGPATIQPAPGRASEGDARDGGVLVGEPSRKSVQGVGQEDTVLAMIADPFGGGDWARGSDGPTFRAGMYLFERTESSWERNLPGTGVSPERNPENESQRAELPGSGAGGFTPQPEITRDGLLKEFLHEVPGPVL